MSMVDGKLTTFPVIQHENDKLNSYAITKVNGNECSFCIWRAYEYRQLHIVRRIRAIIFKIYDNLYSVCILNILHISQPFIQSIYELYFAIFIGFFLYLYSHTVFFFCKKFKQPNKVICIYKRVIVHILKIIKIISLIKLENESCTHHTNTQKKKEKCSHEQRPKQRQFKSIF